MVFIDLREYVIVKNGVVDDVCWECVDGLLFVKYN